MNLDIDKYDYSGPSKPTTNTYSNVQATTTYSTREDIDIFKEAFKNIPKDFNKEFGQDFGKEFGNSDRSYTLHDDYEAKHGPSVPSREEEGYSYTDVETPPQILPHYEVHDDYREPPPSTYGHYTEKSKYTPTKAYVAPHFDVPHPHDVLFNHREAPVKYPVHTSKYPKTYFGHQSDSYENPVDHGYIGDKENSGYSKHYAADYHHKPEKHHFKKGSGDAFKSDHFSSHGEKGDKGFKKYHDFEEEEMGHSGKEGKKGHWDDENAHKKSHHHEGKKYAEGHGNLHGGKGIKYGEEEAHKKGHKTSGYHNTFHKDEFKKEHKFYDEAHKNGHHGKHGGYHTDHDKKHGHKAAGGYYDSAFDQGHKGNSGHYKKGHFDQDHKGHKGSSGHEQHYNHHDDYAKKGGHSEKKKFGYDEHH